MHYRIKKNKKEELQEGRTIQYLAQKCKYSRQYLTDAFNGKIDITRECAINIINGTAENSINLSIKLNQRGIEEMLKYFFDKIDKNNLTN